MDLINIDDFYCQLQTELEQQGQDKAGVAAILPFAKKVYELYPLGELTAERVSDVSGFILSLYDFFQDYSDDQPKIRVFNPRLEEDGWEHRHTQVFVLQRDMAFLMDSMRMLLVAGNHQVHSLNSTFFRVERDASGKLQKIAGKEQHEGINSEALIYFQVDQFSSHDKQVDLTSAIAGLLDEVAHVNEDFQPSVAKLDAVINEVKLNHNDLSETNLSENVEFLNWLKNNQFTFLGYAYYELINRDEPTLHHVKDGQLGLFRCRPKDIADRTLSSLAPGFQEFYDSDQLLTLTKSSKRSSIHRDTYADYVIVKRYSEQGELIGEHRFLGLYTSRVYATSPFDIPLIRQKLYQIYDRSELRPNSYDGKDLRHIMETYPRQELLHGTMEELFDILIGIWQIKQRHQIKLFVRPDKYQKFISCMVYLPRDAYRTDISLRVEKLLVGTFDAEECKHHTYFDESQLAHTHFEMRIGSDQYQQVDYQRLENQIAQLTRDWGNGFEAALIERWGDEQGREYFWSYHTAFPVSYQEDFDPRMAVQDLELFAPLNSDKQIAMSFYQPRTGKGNIMRFKVFHLGVSLELSDLVPILENMGFRVLGERPYCLKPVSAEVIWMHEFTLQFRLPVAIDAPAVRHNFEEAFEAIWSGKVENDPFNNLIVAARLDWQSVNLLRLYARYMKQLGQTISQGFIATTLADNLDITRNLIALFRCRFDPKLAGESEKRAERGLRLEEKILASLDEVANLNQDQVLRGYLQLICATVRTSYFICDESGQSRPYVAIKLLPGELAMVPEPRPQFEIFVYSPRFEGVHLRSGKVARGGLRWSDRLEDYRTEILGLVKAQQVKNAVIVPTGAKGGFVAKRQAAMDNRDDIMAEGVACYRLYISALLDITDNVVGGEIVPPADVVRQDEDDSYLVVAADKGTASFSDIANEVSASYRHWLDDAFASGGSNGYDHKKMGITAKGAWVAVQRHFREMGLNTQQDDFTVVGVGDMAGDVFGNGMLLSEHIKLVAAFNHQWIFIDPEPDTKLSFAERKRLFELPRSGWQDYDAELISEGGGIYDRSAKSITLTPEIQQLLQISEQKMRPAQLIEAILKAPVDLLWNGGIGTYVKAERESHFDVGDRANDELRVNGSQLRCRVIGEGGNLGMTQLGRIEYSLNGGACNTDFIDNAGGVDCSDIEVNIKIALNQLLENEDITYKQRNLLLESLTESVSSKVLSHNYRQTQVITLAQYQAQQDSSPFVQCMQLWEERGVLNRQLEYLPGDEELLEREKSGAELTRPELSVLVSYAKNLLKQSLLDDAVADDVYLAKALAKGFPKELGETHAELLQLHPLRGEIIANRVANDIVDKMGLSFFQRQLTSTGAGATLVARSYVMTNDVFDIDQVWLEIESLDYKIAPQQQIQMQVILMRLGRRATRWMIRNRRQCENASTEVAAFHHLIQQVLANAQVLNAMLDDESQSQQTAFEAQGISEKSTTLLVNANSLFFTLGMADISIRTTLGMEQIAHVYRQLVDLLELSWFADQIISTTVSSRWEDYARESYIDELEGLSRTLVLAIIQSAGTAADTDTQLQNWQKTQASLIERWKHMVGELRVAPAKDFAMYSVALRELQDLVNSTTDDDQTGAVCALG